MNINEQARFIGDQYRGLKDELKAYKEVARSVSMTFQLDNAVVKIEITPLETIQEEAHEQDTVY